MFGEPIHLLDLLWRDDDHRSALNAGDDERGVDFAVLPFAVRSASLSVEADQKIGGEYLTFEYPSKHHCFDRLNERSAARSHENH